MSAIEEMRQAMAAVERRKAEAKAQKMEREQEECVRHFVANFGQALMDELGAQAGHTGNYPFMTLTYRGHAKKWTAGMNYGNTDVATPALLAEWMDQVDAKMVQWEAKRAEFRQRVLAMERSGYSMDGEQERIREYRLQEFEDVREALDRYEAKCRAAVEQEKHDRRAAIKLAVMDFWGMSIAARSAQTREELREIAEWRERHQYSKYPIHVRVVAKRLEAALEDGWERMRRADELREAVRAKEERKAFRPFVFYRAHYGVVAQDGGETFMETQSIDALHYPSESVGVWTPVRGHPVKFEHLVKVEFVGVMSVEELPGWCPKRETEWGAIRVAPEGAERVEESDGHEGIADADERRHDDEAIGLEIEEESADERRRSDAEAAMDELPF